MFAALVLALGALGALRAARGFETLGDHDVAAQCREIAGRLATITF